MLEGNWHELAGNQAKDENVGTSWAFDLTSYFFRPSRLRFFWLHVKCDVQTHHRKPSTHHDNRSFLGDWWGAPVLTNNSRTTEATDLGHFDPNGAFARIRFQAVRHLRRNGK